MSKKEQSYTICPPHPFKVQKEMYEEEEFHGFECSYCCGNGWNWGYDEHRENIHVTCPVCHGSGRMKAMVTTRWVADTKE